MTFFSPQYRIQLLKTLFSNWQVFAQNSCQTFNYQAINCQAIKKKEEAFRFGLGAA
jgi:hypothetical protein